MISADDFDLGAYTTIPHLDVPSQIALGRQLLTAAPRELPPHAETCKRRLLATTRELEEGYEEAQEDGPGQLRRPVDLAADNTSAGAYLVGPGGVPQNLDLPRLGVVLTKNGELVETAAGAAVMGHPAAAVAWLVRQLHVHEGMGLQRGQVVMSGGLTSAVPISAGDTVTAEFAHLGALTLICR